MSMKNLKEENLSKAINVGSRIEELCIQQDIIIEQLADSTKIPLSAMKNILYKESDIDIVILSKICQGLGITLGEFFDY